MKERLQIDTSLGCKLRTTSVQLRAKTGGTPDRQQLPATPMLGRRLVRVLNFGRFGDPPGASPPLLHIMVGDQRVRWSSASDASGLPLRVYEYVEFPIDESVPLYAVLDPTLDPAQDSVDVRVLELG